MEAFVRATLYFSHTDGSPQSAIEKVLRANDELFRSYGIRVSFEIAGSPGEAYALESALGLGLLGACGGGVVDLDKSYVVINGRMIPLDGDVKVLADRMAEAILSAIVEANTAAEGDEYIVSLREPPSTFGAAEYLVEAA
ncbi:hypothetical protein [Stetteria hydrogenophila]